MTRQEPSLEPSLEPSRESAGAAEPTSPPRRFPARCRSHQDAPAEGPCGPCGDARRTHEQQTADDQVAKARQARADRAEKTRLRWADIDRCTRCDQRGYLPSGALCVHDLADTYAAAATAGAAAARAQLATTTGARP